MKIMITFLSALLIFIGIVPFFGDSFFIPNNGTPYSIVLIVFGVLLIVLAIISTLMMGLEKFFMVAQGLFIILVGVLPFFSETLTFIPREGILYSTIVIIVGILGLLYGFMGIG